MKTLKEELVKMLYGIEFHTKIGAGEAADQILDCIKKHGPKDEEEYVGDDSNSDDMERQGFVRGSNAANKEWRKLLDE